MTKIFRRRDKFFRRQAPILADPDFYQKVASFLRFALDSLKKGVFWSLGTPIFGKNREFSRILWPTSLKMSFLGVWSCLGVCNWVYKLEYDVYPISYTKFSEKPTENWKFGVFFDEVTISPKFWGFLKFRKIGDFGISWKFSGKNLNFVLSISWNTYIIEFLVILSTEIPGNSWKRRPQIFVKTRNCGWHFPGKNLIFVSMISGNTYIITFLHIVMTTIPGNFRKGHLDFDKNWKFWRSPENLGFLEFRIPPWIF